MTAYLKSAVWDYLLCVVASTALAYTACSGFYATQPYQDASGVAVIAGVCALLCALLFIVSYSTRTKIIGGPLFAVAVIVALAVGFSQSAGDSVLDDVAGNVVLFELCVALPAIVVFLMSRWRGTSLLLILFGTVFCAAIEYLYWYNHVVALVAFLVGALALFVFRTYQQSLMASESERLAFGSVTVAGVVLGMASVLAAFGLFAAVIAPLDPQHLMVKLVTEHYRVAEIEVRGIASVSDTPDPSLISNVICEVMVMTGSLNDDMTDNPDDSDAERGPEESDAGGLEEETPQDMLAYAQATPLSLLDHPWLVVALAIGLIVLVAAVIALRKRLRARRYRRMVADGPDNAVTSLYLFFLDRFRRMKIPQPESRTLPEYIAACSDVLGKFERGAEGPSFADLTDVYVSREFGGEAVTEEGFALFEQYYKVFYKRARQFTGRLKYCFRFFFV